MILIVVTIVINLLHKYHCFLNSNLGIPVSFFLPHLIPRATG